MTKTRTKKELGYICSPTKTLFVLKKKVKIRNLVNQKKIALSHTDIRYKMIFLCLQVILTQETELYNKCIIDFNLTEHSQYVK